MGLVKKIESPAAQRTRLSGLIYRCIEKLQDESIDKKEKEDIFACIILCLTEIEKSVSATITSWEKRNYWVKVENFRKDWDWVLEFRNDLESNYIIGNYLIMNATIDNLKKQLSRNKNVKIEADKFWIGCGDKFRTKKGCD